MSIIEKQTGLSKSLYQINAQILSEWVELQRGNIEQFIEMNRTFGQRLPEARELGSLVNLQREYGETLWNNTKEAMTSQNAIIQSAFTQTRDAFKTAFAPAEEQSAAPAVAEAPRSTGDLA